MELGAPWRLVEPEKKRYNCGTSCYANERSTE